MTKHSISIKNKENHFWLKKIVLLFILLAGIHCALTQETKRTSEPGDLRSSLRRLEQELALENKYLEEVQKSNEQKLEEKKETRRKLSSQLVDKKIELEKCKKLVEESEKMTQAMAREIKTENILKEFLEIVRSSAERLDIFSSEIPSDGQCALRIREILKNLPKEPDWQNPKPMLQNFSILLDVLDRLHRASSSVHVQQTKIRTAGGLLEEVKLLSVGHLAFAYETSDKKRVGLMLASPADASGYRWSGNVTQSLLDEAKEAISQCESRPDGSRPGGFLSVPMDVTGRLRVDATLREETWAEWFDLGGPVMYPLAAVAILAILLIFERIWYLYFSNADRSSVIRQVMKDCSDKKYDEAMGLLNKENGAVVRTLTACLLRQPQGAHAMEDGIQEQILHELPSLRRFLSWIAILAAVAPLLGLLGTVTGMIRTFNVIRAFGNANASLMAGGISEALITTEAGLVIAIPTVLLCGLLRERMEKILADAERHAATLLNMLSQSK